MNPPPLGPQIHLSSLSLPSTQENARGYKRSVDPLTPSDKKAAIDNSSTADCLSTALVVQEDTRSLIERKLPLEIFLSIFKRCEIPDILQASQVSRTWYEIANFPDLWLLFARTCGLRDVPYRLYGNQVPAGQSLKRRVLKLFATCKPFLRYLPLDYLHPPKNNNLLTLRNLQVLHDNLPLVVKNFQGIIQIIVRAHLWSLLKLHGA